MFFFEIGKHILSLGSRFWTAPSVGKSFFEKPTFQKNLGARFWTTPSVGKSIFENPTFQKHIDCRLAESRQSRRGNPLPGAGGTRPSELHPPTSKTLSKNPSRQSLVRELVSILCPFNVH